MKNGQLSTEMTSEDSGDGVVDEVDAAAEDDDWTVLDDDDDDDDDDAITSDGSALARGDARTRCV